MNSKLAKKLRKMAKNLAATQTQADLPYMTNVVENKDGKSSATRVLNGMSERGIYANLKKAM